MQKTDNRVQKCNNTCPEGRRRSRTHDTEFRWTDSKFRQ